MPPKVKSRWADVIWVEMRISCGRCGLMCLLPGRPLGDPLFRSKDLGADVSKSFVGFSLQIGEMGAPIVLCPACQERAKQT